MSRPRLPFVHTLALYLTALAVLAAMGATTAFGAACGTTATADTLVPITGIVVRAETLTQGRGCGTGSTQVFKYFVTVFGVNIADVTKHDELLAANLYDCFTDGQFVNLPGPAGDFSYLVNVYVYNETAYNVAGDGAMTDLAMSLGQNAAALESDAGNANARTAIQTGLKQLDATKPTYTTACSAQQIDQVQTLAVCQPFTLGLGGVVAKPPVAAPASVTLDATSFATGDSGTVKCDADYSTVRYRIGIGGTFGAITQAACTDLHITVNPATAPASYVFEIALLHGNGNLVAETTCGADTSPGVASAAVCAPLH